MMKEKRCCRCKQFYPATTEYFHNYHRAKDGLYSRCKTCRKEYFLTKHGSKVRIKNDKNYRTRNPIKFRATQIVALAVKNGLLPKIETQSCVICKNIAGDYHHWSYENENLLDVIPVCKQCHKQLHKNETLMRKVHDEHNRKKYIPCPTTTNNGGFREISTEIVVNA